MEGVVSVDVCTTMPSTTLTPLLPIVKPLIVIRNDERKLIEAPEIVTTTAFKEVELQTAERSKTLLLAAATVGMIKGAKKFGG